MFALFGVIGSAEVIVCTMYRVGKVSGIDTSGTVLGMPEMPDTKQPFERPKRT